MSNGKLNIYAIIEKMSHKLNSQENEIIKLKSELNKFIDLVPRNNFAYFRVFKFKISSKIENRKKYNTSLCIGLSLEILRRFGMKYGDYLKINHKTNQGNIFKLKAVVVPHDQDILKLHSEFNTHLNSPILHEFMNLEAARLNNLTFQMTRELSDKLNLVVLGDYNFFISKTELSIKS